MLLKPNWKVCRRAEGFIKIKKGFCGKGHKDKSNLVAGNYMYENNCRSLNGPKHEIFEHGVLTQIRPVRVGDLEARAKKSKKLWFGPYL
jgi:hypothetical protein